MEHKRPYEVPDFIIQDMNEGKPVDARDLSQIEDILASSAGFSYPDASTDSCWQKLRSKLDAPMTVSKSPEKRKFAMFKWAAAAVVFLTIGVGIWQYNSGASDNFTATYKTGLETREVKLPDGSVMRMNHFTEIVVSEMNDQQRILILKEGEVFFQVMHNELPFSVKTGKGDVIVTGTEFNVKSRKHLPFSLFLKTGRINFRGSASVFKLKPGDCVSENKDNRLEIARAENDDPCAWLQDKLVFNSQPLSDIIRELEALYQVKFIYDHNLSSEKFNVVCDNKLEASQVADLLSKVINSKVTIE